MIFSDELAERVPAKPSTYANEVPWEQHPPRQSGFTVVRARGGMQITSAKQDDPDVVQLLGSRYFAADSPSDSPAGPVCAYCHQPMEIPTRRGTEHKKYCSASHKTLATQERAKARAANQ